MYALARCQDRVLTIRYFKTREDALKQVITDFKELVPEWGKTDDWDVEYEHNKDQNGRYADGYNFGISDTESFATSEHSNQYIDWLIQEIPAVI